MSRTEAHPGAVRGASIPVLRTFESQRFRLVIATILAVLGIALSVARLVVFDVADPSVMLDFPAYYHAAERMLAGSSPYTAAQLDGSNGAYCFDCYLYPPFFAQVLSPVALVPLEAAKIIWFFIAYAAAFASTWFATGIGGAHRSLERAIWCLVAVLLFDAVASAVWVGNVGTLVALSVTMVAMGGVAAGVGAGLGSLLKVVPGTLLPAVFAAGRESRIALLVTLGVVGGTLFILAPQAWLEYPVVLRAGKAAWWHACGGSAWDRGDARYPRNALVPLPCRALAIRRDGLASSEHRHPWPPAGLRCFGRVHAVCGRALLVGPSQFGAVVDLGRLGAVASTGRRPARRRHRAGQPLMRTDTRPKPSRPVPACSAPATLRLSAIRGRHPDDFPRHIEDHVLRTSARLRKGRTERDRVIGLDLTRSAERSADSERPGTTRVRVGDRRAKGR